MHVGSVEISVAIDAELVDAQEPSGKLTEGSPVEQELSVEIELEKRDKTTSNTRPPDVHFGLFMRGILFVAC